jgi:hypothetical protein
MEHEITGHARKVYKVWKNPGMSFWKNSKTLVLTFTNEILARYDSAIAKSSKIITAIRQQYQ